MHTWQRLTRDLRSPDFNVSGTGVLNCWFCEIVVSQKLYLLAKKWQVPRAPLHSMKGVARKSSRQEPGLDNAWPPPLGPAPVCWNGKMYNLNSFLFLQCLIIPFSLLNCSYSQAYYTTLYRPFRYWLPNKPKTLLKLITNVKSKFPINKSWNKTLPPISKGNALKRNILFSHKA